MFRDFLATPRMSVIDKLKEINVVLNNIFSPIRKIQFKKMTSKDLYIFLFLIFRAVKIHLRNKSRPQSEVSSVTLLHPTLNKQIRDIPH